MWKVTAKYTRGTFLYPIYKVKGSQKLEGGLYQTLGDAVKAVIKLNGGQIIGNNESIKRPGRMA